MDDDDETTKKKKKEEILNKFRAIGKMSRFYKTLSEEKTAVVKLKGLSSNGKLPVGALSTGNQRLREALYSDNPTSFFDAKKADAENEKMPEIKEITQQQRRASITTRDAYMSDFASKKPTSRNPDESPKINMS